MAATYGYGGEFSSDEDIDKMEQQTERSKFDTYAQLKPTKRQIEEAIETIRKMPHDQDVQLTDDLLAGLLDHYKTQRGPIVDSTRNLYKKIILRLVRGDESAPANNGNDHGVQKETNGNSINNNNPKLVSRDMGAISSDEEEDPKAPSSHLLPETRNEAWKLNATPMEVDHEDPKNFILQRNVSSIDNSGDATSESSSEDDEDEDDDDVVQLATDSNEKQRKEPNADDSEDSEDSEVLDVTPVKPAVVSSASEKKVSTEARKRQSKLTPGSSTKEDQRRHFTRSSQRVATRATAAAKARQADISSGKVDEVASANLSQRATSMSEKKSLVNRSSVRLIIGAAVMLFFAFICYHFRSDLTKSTDRLLKRAIKF